MRIIARLDIKNEKLIKGVMMEGLRVLGNASEFACKYQKMGVSEIFYVDNVASLYGRNNLTSLIKEHVKNCRIPVTVGGGISSIDNVYKLMQVGADKIVINTSALNDPKLIKDIADIFGSQAVAVSIQTIKIGNNYELRTHGGREKNNEDIIEWIKKIQDLGCGEIFITAIHRDGTLKGPDLNLIEKIRNYCQVPLVYSGGISDKKQISYLRENKLCEGLAIGKALHLDKIDKKTLNSTFLSDQIDFDIERELNLSNRSDIQKLNISVLNPNFANVGSLTNLLNDLDLKFNVFDSYNKELDKSEIIILPGVGSFPTGMRFLKENNLDEFLKESSLMKKPIIAICLGMQLLFESSEEIKKTRGLGLLEGDIIALAKNKKNLKLNIGWNKIYSRDNKLISNGYFIHSYALPVSNSFEEILISRFFEQKFVAEVKNKNICGFQYHPEKSSKYGKSRFLYRLKQLAKII